MSLFDKVVNKFFSFITLPYQNAYQCICAGILSIRTRDVVTKDICQQLFDFAPSPLSLLSKKRQDIYNIIKKVNYSNRKTDMLFKLATIIWRDDISLNDFDVMKLPGVGLKVRDIYRNAFLHNVVAIDTAIFRIVSRICGHNIIDYNLVSTFVKNNVSNNLLFAASTSIIKFGRIICKPRKPLCLQCVIKDKCQYYISNDKSLF